MSDFSIGEAAFSGFRFIRREPGTVAIWALASLLFFAAIAGVFLLLAGAAILAIFQTPDLMRSNPMTLFGAPGFWGAIVLSICLVFAYAGVIYGAGFRAFLRPEERGFAYLRFGADELRIVGAYFLLSLVTNGIGLIARGVPMAVGLGIGGSMGTLLAVLGNLAGTVLGVWVTLRLSLAMPMTFAQRRISILRSWKLTQGHVVKILIVWLVLLIVFIAGLVGLMIVFGGAIAAVVAGGSPGAAGIASLVGLGGVAYLGLTACVLPIVVGPMCHVYRALAADPTQTSDVFS